MRELEHEEPSVEPGEIVQLRFTGEECVSVRILRISRKLLVVQDRKKTLEFDRVRVPFDLRGTVLGDVRGELHMWQSREYPDSPPAMLEKMRQPTRQILQ